MYVNETQICLSRGMSTPAIRATCLWFSLYPCFCLCFGLEQMTITEPLRRMILHLSQRGLTDVLIFIANYPLWTHAKDPAMPRGNRMTLPHRRLKLPFYFSGDGCDLTRAVDRVQNAARLVVVEHRHRLLQIELDALADDLGSVVFALVQLAAIDVADAL